MPFARIQNDFFLIYIYRLDLLLRVNQNYFCILFLGIGPGMDGCDSAGRPPYCIYEPL